MVPDLFQESGLKGEEKPLILAILEDRNLSLTMQAYRASVLVSQMQCSIG